MENKQFNNNYEYDVQRENLIATAMLGEKAVEFAFTDTILYEHPEKFSQFDHVRCVNDDAEQPFYRRDEYPVLYSELDKHNFVKVRSPYPQHQHEEEIVADIADSVIETVEHFLEES